MNYPSLRRKAERQIKKSGMAMTLRRVTPGAFDPGAGAETGGTTTDYLCVGVLGAPELKGFGNVFDDGTLLQAGDIQVTLGAETLPVEPVAGDVLVVGDDAYHVVTCLPVKPGGVAVIYKVVGRK